METFISKQMRPAYGFDEVAIVDLSEETNALAVLSILIGQVEFGRQLHLWAVGAHSSTGSATGTARKAWQQLFECQCAVAIAIQAAQDLWCTAHFGSRNFTIPVGVEREGQGVRGRAKLGFETVAVIRWLGRARTDKQCGQA